MHSGFVRSLFKKASEFIAPVAKASTVDEFSSFCITAVSSVPIEDAGNTTAFIGALDVIQDYLIEELDSEDVPCFAYFVKESILQKIVDLVNDNLPEAHVEPLFTFFSAFVNSRLNKYFVQIHVHRPFTLFIGKLEQVYLVDAAKTKEFALDLWKKLKTKPIYLEMIKDEKGNYPLIDFFLSSSLIPGDEYNYARDIITSIIYHEKELSEVFRVYIEKKFFPQILDFLATTIQCVSTIQFDGSLSKIINWFDSLLQIPVKLNLENLISELMELSDPQKLLSFSFLLSYFSAPAILNKFLEISLSEQVLEIVIKCLDSNEDLSQKSAVIFLKTLLLCDCDHSKILPPVITEAADILSHLPAEWLIQCDGSTSIESYESDSFSRVLYYYGKRKDGHNTKLFEHVLGLFKRFKTISLSLCLSLTELITHFAAIAPDLISNELVSTYSDVIQQYSDVTNFEMPNEESNDSPEVRASILAEFAKEIHTTFIASEKIRSRSDVNI